MSDVDFKSLAKEMSGKQKSSSSILLLSIITLVAVIMLWAATTELDNVTRGAGKTISEAQNQLVQSSEPGVLRRRYRFINDESSLRIRSTRLKAEIDGSVPNYSSDLIEAAPSSVSTELALFRARLDDLQAQSQILEQRRLQKLNEIQELKIKYQTASNGLDLIRRQIETLEPLVKAGLAPETRLITLQREEETAIGQANSAKSGQNRIQSALDEIDEQFKAEKQAYITSG